MSISRLSLYKRSNGFWYILYDDGGTIRWKSTGAKLKQGALKALSEFQALLKNKGSCLPFSEFISQFNTSQAYVLRQSTLQRIYRPAFEAFLSICSNKALSSYTVKDVEAFKRQMLDRSSATYVNILFRSLRAAFGVALKWRLVNENPFSQSSSIKVAEKAPAYFRQEQFRTFLAIVKEPNLKDVFTFAVLTGLRQGEILSLQWSNIDLERRTLTVESSGRFLTKTGKCRTIAFSEAVLRLFDKRKRTASVSPYIFHSKGLPLAQSYVQHKFKKYVRLLNLDENLHFHSLRHTFATWLTQGGVPIYEVQKLLGHSSVRMTEIYSHLAAAELHSAVNKLDLKLN